MDRGDSRRSSSRGADYGPSSYETSRSGRERPQPHDGRGPRSIGGRDQSERLPPPREAGDRAAQRSARESRDARIDGDRAAQRSAREPRDARVDGDRSRSGERRERDRCGRCMHCWLGLAPLV